MFNESRLLDCVAYGSQFGHEFNTDIAELVSGHERRTALWEMPRFVYTVLFQHLNPDDHEQVKAAHMASLGSLIAFRFKDWTDYFVEDEPLGTASGVQQTLQLVKSYAFGPLTFVREIVKPVPGTVVISSAGVPIAASIDYTTGLATFTGSPGDPITWTGEFDVPVRFASDRLDSDPAAKRQRRFILSSDVELIEVRDR